MSLIQVENLTFSYDGSAETVFDGVDLRLDTDWKLGFTGRNGRGKTTFLKLLMGVYDYKGKILSSVPFCYFPFSVENEWDPVIHLAQTLLPNIEAWQIQKEFRQLDMDADVLYRPYNTLSYGEQTKVQTALLFLHTDAFYLLDEPTNHLDSAARQTLGQYLNRKKGFILVSHDRALLDACTDHTLSVNKTNIDVQKGSFSVWLAGKEQRDRREEAENEKLKKEIKRLEGAAVRTAGWSDRLEKTKKGTRNAGLRPDRGFIGHKSAKMMQRAKSIENRRLAAADEKAALLKNVESAESLKLAPLDFHASLLAECRNLILSYDGQPLGTPLTFQIRSGDKILLRGRNGTGKSTLFKLLTGEDIPHTGNVYVAKQLKIAYLCQGADTLCGPLSAYAEAQGADETLCRTILRKLDFSRELFSRPLETYSAGQKKKVQLAACLSQNAHLYILDEPLNYIDLYSRMQLQALFQNTNATLLFAEHDAVFCDAVATKIVDLTADEKREKQLRCL